MKNRMREFRTSGSVRDGGGNAPIYSALGAPQGSEVCLEGGTVGERREIVEEGELAGEVSGAAA